MAILTLFKQMYKYAVYSEIVTENKALYVHVNADNDTEHGTPFSDQEMQVLWNNTGDPEVQLILIMCYSGWRIGEVLKLTTNLEEKYFQGGIKTKAGKNRIVPIHSAIYHFAEQKVMTQDGKLCVYTQQHHRKALFYPTLERLGIVGNPKHTPHDCRHTFLHCAKNTVSGRMTENECSATPLVEMLQMRYMVTGHWKNYGQK